MGCKMTDRSRKECRYKKLTKGVLYDICQKDMKEELAEQSGDAGLCELGRA